MKRERELAHRSDKIRFPLAWSLAVAALCVGLIAWVHRESPRTFVSAHGLLHSAIAQRFQAEPFSIPPENPFFAGEPISYYWFFQALGATVSSAFGTDPLHAFEFLVAVSAVALVFVAVRMARSLYGCAGVGFAIVYLVLAGAHPQGPLVLAARVLWRGRGVLADDPGYVWGVAHPVSGYLRLGDPFSQLGPLISYFFSVTARPLAIVALLLVIFCLHRVLFRGGARAWISLAASVALLSALNSLMGIAGVGALGLGLVVCEVLRRRGFGAAPEPEEEPHCLAALAALGSGLLLGSVTFWHLLASGAGGAGFGSGGIRTILEHGLGAASSAWLPLALAVFVLFRSSGRRYYFGLLLTIAALTQLFATAFVLLPAGNYVNFCHIALVMLAVPASACILDAEGRVLRGRAMALGAAFLPTLLLVIWSHTGRPPVAIGTGGGRILALPATSAPARLYTWIENETPRNAVFVIDPASPIRAAAGNTSELPALTGRFLFTERASHYIVEPHEDVLRRTRMASQMVHGAELSSADRRYVEELDRPVFVLAVEPSAAQSFALRDRYGDAIYRIDELALYRVHSP